MKLRFVSAAAIAALTSVGAFAVTGPVSPVAPAPSASFANTVVGAFTDIWQFNLGSPSIVAASLTNVEVSIFGNSTGGILGLHAWLNGTEIFGSISSSTTYPFGPGNPLTITTQVKAGGVALPAGVNYELKISGTGITGTSASYGGNLVATPVPEPETYAMMLAGLGALGFLARRRLGN